jgi:hypothetical protein
VCVLAHFFIGRLIGNVIMPTELQPALVKAHLEVFGSRAGARIPENLYAQAVYRQFYQPLSGNPRMKGEQIAQYLKEDVVKWNSVILLWGVQPTGTQCRQALALLFNLPCTQLTSMHRRLEAILILGMNAGVESWRSHDGGITGLEVEFATDFAQHQLRLRKLM